MMQTTSRSAIETRRKCPTRRFLNYDYAGTGLEPVGAALPLAGGIAVHGILAQVLEARGEPEALERIIAAGLEAYRASVVAAGGFLNQLPERVEWLLGEQSCLMEGLVRGWVRYRLPDILAHYDVVSIEQERRAPLAVDFTLPLRLDVLLRAKQGGALVILDYKTMAYEREAWADSLRNGTQTHLYIPAVEVLYGEHVSGVQYEGLFKGARKRGSKGDQERWGDMKLQQSKLCYGYRGPRAEDGSYPWQAEGTTKKGWSKEPIWQHMPVKTWVERYLAPEDLQAMFQTVPPTRPTPQAMREEVEAVVRGEREWAQRVQPLVRLSLVAPEELPEALGRGLEKNRDQCLGYGPDNRCPFWAICTDRTIAADPLGSELFQPREDHHEDTQQEAA
jgi:hypothetical protein